MDGRTRLTSYGYRTEIKMVAVTLEKIGGASTTVTLGENEYIANNDGVLLSFAIYDHTDNGTKYYRIYKLRAKRLDHSNWLNTVLTKVRDATRPLTWGEAGMVAGDAIGSRVGTGGPKQAASGSKIGLVTGLTLGALWP